mmetsp:Transcript_27031/g.108198  ORF Transcript_27031/g.108198 Transcript_27031/m.108198 type:complete len:117 (+) Transcript_27031:832-1182(+)
MVDDRRPQSTTKAKRVLRVAFDASTPGGSQQPREATLAAVQPAGSTDVVLLVASASQQRWAGGGDDVARRVVDSFRVDRVSPTKLPAVEASDFRYEERGGLRGLLGGGSSSGDGST